MYWITSAIFGIHLIRPTVKSTLETTFYRNRFKFKWREKTNTHTHTLIHYIQSLQNLCICMFKHTRNTPQSLSVFIQQTFKIRTMCTQSIRIIYIYISQNVTQKRYFIAWHENKRTSKSFSPLKVMLCTSFQCRFYTFQTSTFETRLHDKICQGIKT